MALPDDDGSEHTFFIAGAYIVADWLGGEEVFISKAKQAGYDQDAAERIYDELTENWGRLTRAEMRQRVDDVMGAIEAKLAGMGALGR